MPDRQIVAAMAERAERISSPREIIMARDVTLGINKRILEMHYGSEGAASGGRDENDEDDKTLRKEVIELTESLGPEHPDTLRAMETLAVVLRNDKQYEDSAGLYKEVLQKRAKILWPEHIDTLRSMNFIAKSLSCLEQHEDPKKLFREVIEKQATLL